MRVLSLDEKVMPNVPGTGAGVAASDREQQRSTTLPSKLRVLNVIYAPLRMGGAEKAAVDLASNLNSQRFESSFCALARPANVPWRADELEAHDVPLHQVNRRSAKDVAGFRRFVQLLRRGKFDIVHAHLWDAHVWTAAALVGSPNPVFVAHEHSWSYEGERLRQLGDRHVLARCVDAFIAVSDSDRNSMIDRVGLPAGKVHQIPNGIAPQPPGDGARIRGELGIDARTPVIGTVAVLRHEKRLDVLLEAFAILRRQRPNARLVIAGAEVSNGDPTELLSLIARLELQDAVHLIGRRSDIPDLLDAVDIACLSSDYEGMSLAVLEYMAAAKPIVATAVGGIPQMIEDGRQGLLVSRRDPAGLANAIDALLGNRERADELGAQARTKQRQLFSLDAFVGSVEALYERLYSAAAHA